MHTKKFFDKRTVHYHTACIPPKNFMKFIHKFPYNPANRQTDRYHSVDENMSCCLAERTNMSLCNRLTNRCSENIDVALHCSMRVAVL